MKMGEGEYDVLVIYKPRQFSGRGLARLTKFYSPSAPGSF